MAGRGAGALLLRAAALGGLTAAAWLLSGTDASASPEEPPAVEITAEVPRLFEDPAGWATALTNTVLTNTVLDRHEMPKLVPAPVTEPHDEEPAEEDTTPGFDYTSGSQGNTRYGTVTNQAPPEVMKAKAQVRAAAKAAKAAAEVPPPAPPAAPPVVPVKKIVPQLPDLPVPVVKTEPTRPSDLNWTAPGQDAPLPSPQQAPVVATASASSGHSDNSGGTRGVLAVLTSHNSLFPPTSWSVEHRRDGRSPGSLEGLPSTSPD